MRCFRRWRDKFSGFAARLRDEGRAAARPAASFSLFYKQSVECCARLLLAPGDRRAEEAAREVWATVVAVRCSACHEIRVH